MSAKNLPQPVILLVLSHFAFDQVAHKIDGFRQYQSRTMK